MFGHTATLYKESNIIIYGGQGFFSQKMKCRKCFNEVWSFDTLTK